MDKWQQAHADFWSRLEKRTAAAVMDAEADLGRYRDNPLGLCKEVLHCVFDKHIEQMIQSPVAHRRTSVRSCNQSGKTYGLGYLAVSWWKGHPGSRVLVLGPPLEKMKQTIWAEIKRVVHEHPELFKGDNVFSEKIEASPTSYITMVSVQQAASPQKREAALRGQHAPNQLVIIDEGDTCGSEVWRAIEGWCSSWDARVVVAFNPTHQSGELWRWERDHSANVIHVDAFEHVNVVEGKQVIPGCLDRTTVVARINTWCRRLLPDEAADSMCFMLPDFLVGESAPKNIGETEMYPPLEPGMYRVELPEFNPIVRGMWPAESERSLVSRDDYEKARNTWDLWVRDCGKRPPQNTYSVQGLDVSEMGGDKTCFTARYGNWVSEQIMWGGIDPIATAERAASLYTEYKGYQINVDALGVGSGVGPHMRMRGCNAHCIKTTESSTKGTEVGRCDRIWDELCWNFREWMKSGHAMLPPGDELEEEILAARYDKHPRSGLIVCTSSSEFRQIIHRSPDRFVSLILTFKGGHHTFTGYNLDT